MINRKWFGDSRSTGAPLILLHEGLSSVAGWTSFPHALATATERRVLAYDRFGYGSSPAKPGPWSPDFMHTEATYLAQVLAEESIEQAVLVGHSDGASIALLYPSQAPASSAEISGVVSLAGHLFVEDQTVTEIQKLRQGFADTLRRPLARQHDNVDALFNAWSSIWVSDRFRSWAIDAELASVTCPVLAIQGTGDVYGSWAQVERMAAAVSGPIETIELAGINHWPHREATDRVTAEISRFVALL